MLLVSLDAAQVPRLFGRIRANRDTTPEQPTEGVVLIHEKDRYSVNRPIIPLAAPKTTVATRRTEPGDSNEHVRLRFDRGM